MKCYPDYPGHSNIDTSKDAAEALSPYLNRLQAIALETIREYGGLTTEQVSEITGISPKAIEPRVSELKRKRLIADSGQRRKNRSGKLASVLVEVLRPPTDQCQPDGPHNDRLQCDDAFAST